MQQYTTLEVFSFLLYCNPLGFEGSKIYLTPNAVMKTVLLVKWPAASQATCLLSTRGPSFLFLSFFQFSVCGGGCGWSEDNVQKSDVSYHMDPGVWNSGPQPWPQLPLPAESSLLLAFLCFLFSRAILLPFLPCFLHCSFVCIFLFQPFLCDLFRKIKT